MIIFATFIRENHVVTEFLALLIVEKCDAASLLYVFVSHLQALGIELAKITGRPSRQKMVDGLIRQVAEYLGRSSPWHQRFLELQEFFIATNLELQGIHQVRWLSRGDAVLRTVTVFPALIVMLSEWDETLYKLATSYRFHFLLFFLADVLEQLNILNKSFQQREIRRTMSHLETRYVDCGDDFGGGLSARLSPFIMKYWPDSDKPEVAVQGVDSDGRPTTHKFQLHENPSEDYPTLGTHDACVDLCTSFAETLVSNLSKRFEDLDNLVGVRLFMLDEYPPGRAERHKQCVEWLMSLVSLFRAQETDQNPSWRRDYERRGGNGRQLKLLAHGATGATGTRATGATGTLATGATGTRATGVTGSVANSERQEQRTHGRLEQLAHGRLAQRAHGRLAQRSHGRLELRASRRPPPFNLPKLSHTVNEVNGHTVNEVNAAHGRRSRRRVDPPPLTSPVEVTGDSGPAEPGREESRGAEPGGTEPGGAAPGGAEPSGEQSPWSGSRGPATGGAGAGDSATGVVFAGGSGAAGGAGARGCRAAEGTGAGGSGAAAGAGTKGSESAVARSPWSSCLHPRVPLTSQQLHDWYGRRQGRVSGARGSAAGGTSTDVTGAGSGAGPGGARTGGTGAAEAGGAELEVAAAGDTEAGDLGTRGACSGGAAAGGAGSGGAGAEGSGAAGGTGTAGGAGSAGGTGTAGGARAAGAGSTAQPRLFFAPPSPSSQPPSDSVLCQCLSLPSSTGLPLQPGSPLPAPSPYTEQTGGLTERREPASRPVSPVRSGRFGRRVPCSCQPVVPGTHLVVRRPSSPPQSVPLPSPPASSLSTVPEPESVRARAAHPTVTRLLATVVTDPSFESTVVSALVAELVDFAAACRLDYATSLVAESASVCPPSVGDECALGTDVLEDRQEDLECLAASAPHLVSMLLAPEGDPDAPDIPTPRSYAEAITGPYSSQWQTAMDAEMASWKSTGTYVDEVPPPGANIVSGMWIFRVKRPPGSPPVFKARYVARGFSQREGVQ
ncbi:unnamed protein product [Closterium sp. NIES-53]